VAQDNAVQPASKRTGKAVRSLLFLILLGLAVHLLLPQITTPEHSLQVIQSMRWWAVGLAAGAQVLSYLGSGVLLQAIAAMPGDRLSVVRGILITAASYSVGLVAGGMVGSGAVTYRGTRGSGVSAEGALLAGWLPALVYDGALLVVLIFGLLYLLVVHKLTAVQALSFAMIALILSLLAAAIVWGTRHCPWLTNLATRPARRRATLRRRPYDPALTQVSVGRLFDAWDRLGGEGWRGPALGVTINTAFDMLTLYLVFIGARHRVSLEVLLAGLRPAAAAGQGAPATRRRGHRREHHGCPLHQPRRAQCGAGGGRPYLPLLFLLAAEPDGLPSRSSAATRDGPHPAALGRQ
jgi:uncharacterized membrane protein YbhN (UPF0104 family)